MESKIGICEINDCEWWAGETLEECVECYIEENGVYPEECEYARMLTRSEMDQSKFFYGEPPWTDESEHCSFTERLNGMIAEGATFPCFFATSEW